MADDAENEVEEGGGYEEKVSRNNDDGRVVKPPFKSL
jgi:hypothetical protein